MGVSNKHPKRAKKPAKAVHHPPTMVCCCLRSLGDGQVERLPIKPYRCDPHKDLAPSLWEWAIEEDGDAFGAYPRADCNLTELCRRGGRLDIRFEADGTERLFAPIPSLERRKGLERSLLGYAAKRKALGDNMTAALVKGLLGVLIAHWRGAWPRLARPATTQCHQDARFGSLAQLVEAATYRAALLGSGPSIRPIAANAARMRATWTEMACRMRGSSTGAVRSLGALEREMDAERWFDVAVAGLDPLDVEGVRCLLVSPPWTSKGRVDWKAFLHGFRRFIATAMAAPEELNAVFSVGRQRLHITRELSEQRVMELTVELTDDVLRRRVQRALRIVQARLETFPSAAASLAKEMGDTAFVAPPLAASDASAIDGRRAAAHGRAQTRREALRRAYIPEATS